MKYIASNQSQKFVNSKSCTVYEYDFGDADINGATAIIAGRYPESGWAMNTVCKELIYVLSGTGILRMLDREVPLGAGDAALILPGEKYHFIGDDLRVYMPCSPAWYPEQHVASE